MHRGLPSPPLFPYTTLFRSPYCAAMVAGSAPPMFDSYVAKNALTRSLACGMRAVHHADVPGRNSRRCDIDRRGSRRLYFLDETDRKSTRLNSSHQIISYAVL